MNTDNGKLTSVGSSEYPSMFSFAISTSALPRSSYETGDLLFISEYAQYFSGGYPSSRYVMRQDWMPDYWLPVYTLAAPQLRTILMSTDIASSEHAIANIWWVWMFDRISDLSGPIPYFEAASGAATIPYDKQADIYADFFKRLDSAIAVLHTKTESPFGSFDLIYKNKGITTSYWLKFANTLKLRLALRISKVDPVNARKYAEEAVAGGVMEKADDDAYLARGSGSSYEQNGLALVAYWNETRMSGTIQSILQGYNDPRLSVFFQPASATGKYHGLRSGFSTTEGNIAENSWSANSQVGTRWVTGSDDAGWTPNYSQSQDILHCAEAFFLKAEGALNGWNMGGTPQDFYQKGIAASFNQWNITDATLLNNYINSSATPIALNDFANSPAVNNYPVKFSSDLLMERKQIAQQKWIALFPDSYEAWAEIRRSGYPELYYVLHSDNPDLPNGTHIRRMPYLDIEKQSNADGVNKGVTYLNGPDNAATPLWWDKN